MTTSAPRSWSPFRHGIFALLWNGIVLSNVGTWMHDVSAGWLIATLTSSPVLVAAEQAATTLTVFFSPFLPACPTVWALMSAGPSGQSQAIAEEIEDDRGPVMVTVEYKIDPVKAEPFLTTMDDYGETRHRNGAYAWDISEDIEDLGTYQEYFLVDTWLEHERQHHRVVEADLEIEAKVMQYTLDQKRTRARHLIAP